MYATAIALAAFVEIDLILKGIKTDVQGHGGLRRFPGRNRPDSQRD